MHKALPLLLLVLGAALAALFFFWPDGSASLAPELGDTQKVAGGSDPEQIGGVPLEKGIGDRDDEALPAGFAEFARQQVEAGEEAQDTGRPLVVQLWETRKGQPAGGAEVFVLEAGDRDDFEGPFARHWGVIAEEEGQRFVADDRGRVTLPPVREWVVVAAQRPGLFGVAALGRGHEDVEYVLLRDDETLTVRVVDDEGRPVADAPVGVVHWIPTQDLRARASELDGYIEEIHEWMAKNPGEARDARRKLVQIERQRVEVERELSVAARRERVRSLRVRPSARPEVHTRRRTDEQGLAVFRHFQDYRDHWRKEMPDTANGKAGGKGKGKATGGKKGSGKAPQSTAPPSLDLEVALLLPVAEPVTAGFASDPVPDRVVELRMPPMGSVVMRTVDLEGEPFLHPVHAEVALVDSMGVTWGEVHVRKEHGADRVVFPRVGLGLHLRAMCWLDDEDFSWEAPLIAGPSEQGVPAEIDLVVAPEDGMFRGRLLDAEGRALSGEATFLITSALGRLEGEEVELTEGGGFHLPYKVHEHHRGPFRLEIRRHDAVPVEGLAAPLTGLPVGRVSDLGDLVLDGFGAIASGVVRNDLGEPIEGAWIQLERQRDVGDERPELEFVEEAFVETETSESGEFVLFGALESGRYRLRVEAEEHFELESEHLRPGVPMDLTLVRRSQVVGTMLRPEWLSAKDVRVTLRRFDDPVADGERDRREDQLHDYQGDTYVYFDWVRPGIYSLSLRTLSFPDPFLEVAQFELAPGTMGVHPRLRELDIGAALHRFEVRAVGADGAQMPMGAPLLANIVRPDGSTAWVGFPWKSGVAEIVSASPRLELLPTAPGYRAQRTVVAPGESRILFQQVPALEVRAAGLSQLLGDTPAWLLLEPVAGEGGMPGELLAWDGMSRRIAGWHTKTQTAFARVGPEDVATMSPMSDGRYRVTARIGRRTRGVAQQQVSMGEISVRLTPGRASQRVDVAFDAQAVQNALVALQGGGDD